MTTLQTEIASGPLATELAPFVASGSDVEVAVILNDKRFTMPGGVSRGDFALFAGKTGLRSHIQDHADTTTSPLRSIALTLLDFLQGGVSETLTLSSAASQQMVGAWVQAGAITADQMAELNALATQPASRADIVLGRDVTVHDIALAVRDSDGNSLLGA